MQGSPMSAAVSVACCPGREMLCWPVCDGQFPLRLRFARRVQTPCPFRGGGLGSNAVGSVAGRASQRWWEGPRGLFVGPVGSLLGDTVVFGLSPGGGRGGYAVHNPVFTLDYSVLK